MGARASGRGRRRHEDECRSPGRRARPAAECLERRTLLHAGHLDSSFGNGGAITFWRDSGALIGGVAVQPDGNIVEAGSDGVGHGTINRFLPNGLPDPDFQYGGVNLPYLGGFTCVAIEPGDHKILAVGVGPPPGETIEVVRLNTNGLLNGSFGQGGRSVVSFASVDPLSGPFGVGPSCVVVQPDGKILIAGSV